MTMCIRTRHEMTIFLTMTSSRTSRSRGPPPFSDLRGERGILQYYFIFLPRDSCAAAAPRLVERV